ncbi:MAG: autotransporter assembly complex family protein [Sphingomonadales bacterium]
MNAAILLALVAAGGPARAQSTLAQPDAPPGMTKAQKKAEKAERKRLKQETKRLDEEKKQEEEAELRRRESLGLPSYAYRVDIEGLEKTGLEKLLKERSDLVRLRKEEPLSIWDLRARIRRDITGFADVLRSEGYYGARITYEVDRDAEPIRVAIAVEPGERFTIGAYSIELTGPEVLDQSVKDEARKIAEAQVGQPARSETVALAFGQVMAKLPQLGYPRAKLAVQDFKANHLDQKLTAKVRIDTGPKVKFGEITLDGLESVKSGYVMKAVTWRTGEVYDSRKVEAFRQELTEMNLFASIRVDTDDPLQGDRQPIRIRLREAKHRSIGATASYSTVNGFGGSIFWEHRNFFGAGERLVLSLEGDQKLQQFKADLTKPRFLRKDQKLLIGAEVAREDTDAFLEYRGVLRAAVEREVNKRLRIRIGPEVSYLDTRDAFQPSKNVLLGLQSIVNYDHSDDLLDPTKGYRLNGKVTPYLVFGDAKNFITMEGQASVYFRLDEGGRYVSASRVKVGALFGADSIINIPASKRFYAGGGNSIRGYGYQAIGPKDPLGEPIGGKSLFEVSTELRIKITDTWGVVPFFEGGSVFDSQLPDFSRKLRWGAGLGVRYYTGFGPIRLDVAFPINKQPGDDKFQIYVSIGQAF